MRRIGIIFAMKEELEETKKKMEVLYEFDLFELRVFECSFGEHRCFLVESGVGKVNAARTAQILISNLNVDLLINVGVAGSVAKGVNKCDIVVAEYLVQHDYDLTPFGREKGVIPNVGKFIECDKNLLEIVKNINIDSKVIFGTIASGDIFVTDESMARKINCVFEALCVEMEGAAIAQVCYLCNVPFLVLRAISDSPYEENNQLTHDDFLKISSSSVSKLVVEFIKKLN